jgi:predicted dehydrogenase
MSTRRRTLVVGVGSIGERHVRCFGATNRTTLAICEPNADLRAAVAQRYEISETYASLDDALKSDFTAAVVATPAHLHVQQAMLLAKRGVNVLVEKPLSTVVEGVAELKASLAKQGLLGAVAYSYRANPVMVAMRDVWRAIDFGRPLQAIVSAGQSFPTYRPAYANTYYRSRATGGGAIQDALTHLINAVEWLLGPATRVAADADRLALAGVDVEDTAHVLARHGDAMALYHLNQHQPANEAAITLVGAKGQLRAEFHRRRVAWLAEVDGVWQETIVEPYNQDDVFRRQADAFLDAVEQEVAPLCSLAEGEATLRTVTAILQSLESHRWEECDR